MNPQLKIVIDHEPTRAEIMQAKIEQSWREYRTETNQPWQPIDRGRGLHLIDPDRVVSYKVIPEQRRRRRAWPF